MASACMVFEPAAIRLTAELGLATILGDSEDGLSIQEIAEKTGVDALKFGSSSHTDANSVIDKFFFFFFFQNVFSVFWLPKAGSVNLSQVTLPIIDSVVSSKRISNHTICLLIC